MYKGASYTYRLLSLAERLATLTHTQMSSATMLRIYMISGLRDQICVEVNPDNKSEHN